MAPTTSTTATSIAGAAATTVVAGAASTTTVAAPVGPTDPATTPAPAPEATAPAPTAVPMPPVGVDPCGLTPIVRYAIGDSVMLGAAGNLADAGFCVDAIESRAFVNGLDQVMRLRSDGRLGSAVVVGLGTNGPIGTSDLGRMMAELAAVPRVVMLTTHADRSYVAGNNDKVRALPASYPNVVVVDWDTEAANCPGDCFYDDGIHLTPDGRAFYTRLATDALVSTAPSCRGRGGCGAAVRSRGAPARRGRR